MKKLLAVAVFAAAFSVGAYADSPVKFSLFDKIAAPASEDMNFGLGLIYSNTQKVRGLDLTIGASRVEDLGGVQFSFFFSSAAKMEGASLALYSRVDEGMGLQWGLVNHSTKDFTGWQWGMVNFGEGNVKGLQLGAVNYAKSFTGLQFGFVNWAERMESGLQIGLVNVIRENGWLPVMVIVNGKF